MDGLSRQQEMVLTSGEKRATMPRQYYEQLCHFIIESLETQESVPFFGLLDQAQQNFAKEIKGSLSWYLIHVKQDLQARKIISVERDINRNQWIRLRRKYKQELKKLMVHKVLNPPS